MKNSLDRKRVYTPQEMDFHFLVSFSKLGFESVPYDELTQYVYIEAIMIYYDVNLYYNDYETIDLRPCKDEDMQLSFWDKNFEY